VDVGFVLLVSAVCVRSLTSSETDAERVAGRWRSELLELERVLRELITEAGTASSNLDRRLLKRKAELETLLKKLEDGAPPAPQAAKVSPRAVEQEWRLGDAEEFPNESWNQSPDETDTEPYDGGSIVESRFEPAEVEELGGLEALVEQAADTIELSSQIERSVVPALSTTLPTRSAVAGPKAQRALPADKPASATATKASLAARIEKIQANEKDEEERVAQETFKRLSIMDPTAYRIARRLLADGTEIHVVARKLDLPVSEMRLLDRLMREESAQRERNLEVGPNYKQIEAIPARKIVRSSNRPKLPPAAGAVENEIATPSKIQSNQREASRADDVDGEIERELALL